MLGIFSSILALMGYKVDVTCYSDHLSKRDYSDFKIFFEKLKIEEKIFYGTFNEICEKRINKNGDIRIMCSNLINGIKNSEIEEQTSNSVLLVDESDVLFQSSFYGQTYNPSTLFKTKEICTIIEEVWKNKSLE